MYIFLYFKFFLRRKEVNFMKFKAIFFSIVFGAVLAVFPSSAEASANTKVDLVQDCSTGCSEAVDMAGPTGFGFINFNQNANGDLRLVVSVKNAEPNTEYSGAFLVCGPTHSTACGFVDVGDLVTNEQGNGNATMILSAESLQSSPFGPGSRTDHFDLLKGVGDTSAGVYAATGINYVVPAL
jgi:hypothetical protein